MSQAQQHQGRRVESISILLPILPPPLNACLSFILLAPLPSYGYRHMESDMQGCDSVQCDQGRILMLSILMRARLIMMLGQTSDSLVTCGVTPHPQACATSKRLLLATTADIMIDLSQGPLTSPCSLSGHPFCLPSFPSADCARPRCESLEADLAAQSALQ